ncbi:MAG: hypothetical protein ABI946_00155 [Chthoniobacterales bacterium]
MKTKSFILLVLGVASLSGCATSPQPVTKNNDIDLSDPAKRSYSKAQLDKTGRQNAGEALAQVDPAVSVSGGH